MVAPPMQPVVHSKPEVVVEGMKETKLNGNEGVETETAIECVEESADLTAAVYKPFVQNQPEVLAAMKETGSNDIEGVGAETMMKCVVVKKWECTVCEKQFDTRAALAMHVHVHSEDRIFACSVCHARFTTKDNLTQHQSEVHVHKDERYIIFVAEQPFVCSICGVRFAINSNLKLHQRTHKGERPFKCSVCGANFVRNSFLNRHLCMHTGERHFE
jgi:transcription initiation factor IIE alpha subunit